MAAETFDLPDGHRTVELRALAARPGTRSFTSHDGVVLVNTELEFGGVYGRVPENLLFGFLERQEFQGQLLFVSGSTPEIAGLEFSRALVFAKAAGTEPTLTPLPTGMELRLADKADDFSLFEDAAMVELYETVRREPMSVVVEGSRVLSAAYTAWRSEGYGDISVDTVEAARGRGLAGHTAQAVVRALEAEGIVPVWGAEEKNAASLRLARRLGFTEEVGPVYLAKYR